MRRRGRVLGVLLAAAAIAALIAFGLAPSDKSAAGRPAPRLPSERLGGAPVTLHGLVAGARGKASLVVFWASWCDPCKSEAAAIESFARSPAGRGRIVGVDWSDARAGAVAFIHRYGWTFPTLRDGEGLIGDEWRMTGLPTTFVLDGSGHIAMTLRGPQSEDSLRRAVASAEGA